MFWLGCIVGAISAFGVIVAGFAYLLCKDDDDKTEDECYWS